MGLTTRLALARTLVWTGLQNEPKTLAERVRQLCSQRADLIVIGSVNAGAEVLDTARSGAVRIWLGRNGLNARVDI